MPKSFKVGEAPWENEEKSEFAVGDAPWEKEESSVPEKGLLKGTLEALPFAGSLAGGVIGTAGAPGLGTIAGAGLGAGAGKALQNLGERYLLGEEKTREDIYAKPALATLEGATAEMGGQLIGPALKIGAEKGAKALEKVSETQAFKSTGAMLKDFRSASDKGLISDLGKFIKDKKIAGVGTSFEKVSDNANAVRQKAGIKLDEIYKSVEQSIPNIGKRDSGFNPIRDKDEILSSVAEKLGDAEGAKRIVSRVDEYLTDLGLKYGDNVLDPKTANGIKGQVDDVINYSRNPLSKEPNAEKAFLSVRRNLEKKIAGDIDFLGNQLGSSNLSKSLREANKEYGYSTTIRNIARDKVNRESANQLFSLTDTIAGGAATTAGAISGGTPEAILYGLGGIAANKAAKKFGPGLLSKGSGAGARMLRSSPEIIRQAPKGLIRGE